jgi:hypothetical protein
MKTAKQWLSDNGYEKIYVEWYLNQTAELMDQFLKEATEQPSQIELNPELLKISSQNYGEDGIGLGSQQINDLLPSQSEPRLMTTPEEKVNDILIGMIGIGGIPSNEDFYAEFDMRLREALGIEQLPEPSQPEDKLREWLPINETNIPKERSLLLTSSKVIVIGDYYKEIWRIDGATKWIGEENPKTLKSDYDFKDITHWMPLPKTTPSQPEPPKNDTPYWAIERSYKGNFQWYNVHDGEWYNDIHKATKFNNKEVAGLIRMTPNTMQEPSTYVAEHMDVSEIPSQPVREVKSAEEFWTDYNTFEYRMKSIKGSMRVMLKDHFIQAMKEYASQFPKVVLPSEEQIQEKIKKGLYLNATDKSDNIFADMLRFSVNWIKQLNK